MEPKYRHRYPPCPDYDVGCMEAWLEHMAQKGLHLDGPSGFFLGLATFTEGQDHNDPDIADGVGFSTWKLEFLTPTSGMATLIDQHVFGHHDEEERLPFTIVPLK